MENTQHIPTLERIVLGLTAGFVSVLSKFMAQDYTYIVDNAMNLTADQILSYKVGYGILTPILMIMGGFIAWVSEENSRIKVVALAISAPALITTWAGGTKATSTVSLNDLVVPSVYAQQTNAPVQQEIIDPNTVQEEPLLTRIQKGIGIFFGFGKEPIKYKVVVGSYTEKKKAEEQLAKIKEENPKIDANLIEKKSSGEVSYIITIGEYNYLSEANQIRAKALDMQAITEAHLSEQGRQSP